MPSTYSSLLRLELMATGEKSATWGDITNTNLGTLLEKSIAGLASVNVTGGNVTLTALNGTDDESRCAIISVTGTPGVSRNVVAPSSAKLYAVLNGSNAAIVFKGAATTGVTLSAGEKAWLAWNGSDFVAVGVPTASPIFTGQVIGPSGSVSVPSFSFVGDLNNGWWAPAADTQAWSLSGAEAMRLNATGLGLGNSPTDSATYGGRVFDAAGPGYFRQNGTPSNYVAVGSVAGVASVFVGAAIPLAFYTTSVERMRIDASGNLGIGVTPSAKLHVRAGTNQNILMQPGTTSGFKLNAVNDAVSANVDLEIAAQIIRLYAAGALAVTLDASGQLGIGITPNAILAVRKNSTSSSESSSGLYITSGTGAGTAGIQFGADQTAGYGYIQTLEPTVSFSTKPLVLMPNGGSVGVGTTPAKLLHVSGNGTGTVRLQNTGASGRSWDFNSFISGVGNAGFEIYDATASATRLAITSDGRIYGGALHNNAGSVTGTTTQYIASGTYTPTLTNVANISASTARQCQWMRVGNVVTVSGQFDATHSSTGTVATEVGVSLPIASAFTTAFQCGGTSNSYQSGSGFTNAQSIDADATNDRARVRWMNAGIGGSVTYMFTFTYEVL